MHKDNDGNTDEYEEEFDSNNEATSSDEDDFDNDNGPDDESDTTIPYAYTESDNESSEGGSVTEWLRRWIPDSKVANITQTQRNRFFNFHRRAMNLCRIDENEQKHVTSPISSNVIHSLTLVHQCINGDVCSNFKNYFEVTNHGRVTRNLGYLLKTSSTEA